ncbi:MAG TPA: hypothetical protein VJ801_10415 [Polyangia bacterium]|jgi:hypothetical protein|nr:hypothetical protein [Polyangia bacterium]
MSYATFPNGSTLISSALTPDALLTIFQALVAQILGFDTTDPTVRSAAYSAVRVSWQQEGQPAWAISEDVCILRANPEDTLFGRARDGFYSPKDAVSLHSEMGYTQVWSLGFVFYGPNCEDRARLIVSAFALDWVHDVLVASNLYVVPDWHRPVYTPELFSGQWWKRSDVELQFNELVIESLTVPSAAGVDVRLLKDTGLERTISIRVNGD